MEFNKKRWPCPWKTVHKTVSAVGVGNRGLISELKSTRPSSDRVAMRPIVDRQTPVADGKNLPYMRTLIGGQKKFHNAFAFLRLAAV